tara:strand:- start:220 stop:435 length:216 start_codon:yes stop_codon:yes gene_type:complete
MFAMIMMTSMRAAFLLAGVARFQAGLELGLQGHVIASGPAAHQKLHSGTASGGTGGVQANAARHSGYIVFC